MSVTVQAAATVGNFGPGFDVLSLALAGLGDKITITPSSEDAVFVEGPYSEGIPGMWEDNVVGPVIDRLRSVTADENQYDITIRKGQPGGSGLGSSASSASGAALAYHAYHAGQGHAPLSPRDLINAAARGEEMAGGGNPDDIAAVILGGLAIIRPSSRGPRHSRVQPPEGLLVAVVRPELELPTAEMRAMLPAEVPLEDAVWNLAHTAELIRSFQAGDVAGIGACLIDRVAVPYRIGRVPYLTRAIEAAKDAGCTGACLSGSGPSVIAVTDHQALAEDAVAAMCEVVEGHDLACDGFVARPEMEVPHEAVLR